MVNFWGQTEEGGFLSRLRRLRLLLPVGQTEHSRGNAPGSMLVQVPEAPEGRQKRVRWQKQSKTLTVRLKKPLPLHHQNLWMLLSASDIV